MCVGNTRFVIVFRRPQHGVLKIQSGICTACGFWGSGPTRCRRDQRFNADWRI